MINLLKNLSGNVVRVDLVVLKIVVHESVLQSMKDSSIMAPLRQEWRQRHLALHITQVWMHKISSTMSSSGECLIFAQNFMVRPKS